MLIITFCVFNNKLFNELSTKVAQMQIITISTQITNNSACSYEKNLLVSLALIQKIDQ
jgi:hypothetical protein